MLNLGSNVVHGGPHSHFNFMTKITLIGFLAATCTTLAFLPQVVKTIKSRQTKDISLGMYLIFTMGLVLWLAYGILIQAPPIIIANVVTLFLALWILILKMRHG